MRVLISEQHTLSLSRETVQRARELGAVWAGQRYIRLSEAPSTSLAGEHYYLPAEVPRHDLLLLQLFEEFGSAMSSYDVEDSPGAACIEIPDDIEYVVHSYLSEWIADKHRTWSTEGEQPIQGPVFSKYSTFIDWKD